MTIKQIIEQLKFEIESVKDLEALKQLKAKYTSNSVFFIKLKESIKKAKDKQVIGLQIKEYSQGVNEVLNKKKNQMESLFFLEKKENPILSNNEIELAKKEGTIHPLTEMSFLLQDFFDNMKYHYTPPIEVENEEINFNVLNLPIDHPARDMQDTFFLEEDEMLLRTHATNVSARKLKETKNDKYAGYSIGPVFRNDDNDATHSFQFHQIDFFNMGPNINVANLKWTLSELMKIIFDKDTRIRFRPSYFPFTEPSYEVDIKWKDGWMEILGSGMFNTQVMKNVSRDPKKTQALAGGVGLERIVMLKYDIKDIRDFYVNDLNFLKTYKK